MCESNFLHTNNNNVYPAATHQQFSAAEERAVVMNKKINHFFISVNMLITKSYCGFTLERTKNGVYNLKKKKNLRSCFGRTNNQRIIDLGFGDRSVCN